MSGRLNDQGAAIGKLYGGMTSARMFTIEYEIAGTEAAAWAEDDKLLDDVVTTFIMRQTGSIGGGTTEMARNVISERVLGMPREPARDRDVAFRDVPRGSSARR